MHRRAMGALGVLVMAGAAACSDPVAPTTQDRLVGSWAWVEATGGIAGETRTPESTGESMTLVFSSADSVELSRAGSPAASTTYRLVVPEDGGAMRIEYEEPLFGFDSQEVSFDGDDLMLTDPCCDGFVYRFRRLP